MQGTKLVVSLVYLVLLFKQNCARTSNSVNRCIDYYKSDEVFELSTFLGNRYAVYFWPPSQRQRDTCELASFEILSAEEIGVVTKECTDLDLSNQTVLRASYTNNAGKPVKLLYYGSGEVKTLIRSCDRIWKYIFRRVNDEYVLGINCASGGRGVLWSKTLPTAEDVNAVVGDIEIMTGREGSPDCELT